MDCSTVFVLNMSSLFQLMLLLWLSELISCSIRRWIFLFCDWFLELDTRWPKYFALIPSERPGQRLFEIAGFLQMLWGSNKVCHIVCFSICLQVNWHLCENHVHKIQTNPRMFFIFFFRRERKKRRYKMLLS